MFGDKTKMNKTIAVTLLISASFLKTSTASNEAFPPPTLVGIWRENAEIFGSFKIEPYPSKAPEGHQDVVIAIDASGTITGRVGQAVFNNCTLRRNRGWLGRTLNVKSDFIVLGGHMEGKIAPKDEGGRREFTIPFNIKNGKLSGTIMLLPKFPLTHPLNLEKDKRSRGEWLALRRPYFFIWA